MGRKVVKTYGKNNKGSEQCNSKSSKNKPTTINQYIYNINLFLINTNTQGTSSSGDEFDQLLKGPIYRPQNQSSHASFSKSNFYNRQESFPSYNSDATPLSSSSSVHLFKDVLKDCTNYYSPLTLEPFPKIGINKKKPNRNKRTIQKRKRVNKRVPQLKCAFPKRVTPKAISSTPNNLCVSTSQNTWMESCVSPIMPQPFCMSDSTPKSSLPTATPTDRLAIEENCEKNQRPNENTFDISALAAGLNRLGLSPKENNKFISYRRSKKKSEEKRSNLDLPHTQISSNPSFTVEENNHGVFESVSNMNEKKHSIFKVERETLDDCSMSRMLEGNKENCDIVNLISEAPNCKENVESRTRTKEFKNQSTVLDCSSNENKLDGCPNPVSYRTSEVNILQQKITNVKKDCFQIDDSFPKELAIRTLSLLPGKKWRKSFIKQKQSESRRATVNPSVLAKLLKDIDLNMTYSMSTEVINDTHSFICEPNESLFKKVSIRTKRKPEKQNNLFDYIPEEELSPTINETSACILEPVVEESDKVLSPTLSAVKLRQRPHKINLSIENVSDNSSEKTHKSSIMAEVDKTPNQIRETKLSLKETVEETSEIHEFCTPKSATLVKEDGPNKIQSTNFKFVNESTFETPPCLKENAQGFSTITKRKQCNQALSTRCFKDKLSFENSSNLECTKFNDEQDLMETVSGCGGNKTSLRKSSDFFQDDDSEELGSSSLPSSPYYETNETSIKESSLSHLDQDAESEDEEDSFCPVNVGSYCKQVLFTEAFSDEDLERCQKVGEGLYGEVFMFNKQNRKTVVKIIPIEGDLKVNGEPQKKYSEVLSELIITEQLSLLRNNTVFSTEGFCQLIDKLIVKGQYPPKLIELWHLFKERSGSDNDCPDMFQEDQLYLVLELEHGGKSVETFTFSTAQQCYSVLLQAIFSLAIAEATLEFEHRDMHYGNILVDSTDKEHVSYVIKGKSYRLPSYGVKATIIDFTLSRITLKGEVLFYDLSTDPELFTATGSDYQFEIYRIMKNDLNNNWVEHAPVTNLRWLDYLVDKFLNEVNKRIKKKDKQLKKHKNHIKKLKNLECLLKDKSFFSSFQLAEYLLHSYLETCSIIIHDQ